MSNSPCPYCGTFEPVVWVHGHGQCAVCKTNVAPCCDGATGCSLDSPKPAQPSRNRTGESLAKLS